MFTLTFYHPRTRVLRSISTPSRPVALQVFGALARGYRVRVWHKGCMLSWRIV